MTVPCSATTITVSQTLALLDGPFRALAEGVSEDRYALWLGSGISLGRMDGLEKVVQRVVEFLRKRIEPGNPTCRFNKALKEALAIAGLSDEKKLRIDIARPFLEWENADEITRKLADSYAKLLDTTVEGESEDFLLWEGVDVAATFADPGIEPDVEHLCIAILILEGVASDIASANWDGLVEKAVDVLADGEPTVVVCVCSEDLREPGLKSRLIKFHGCAVKARSDEKMFRSYLVARHSQILSWGTRQANKAMVNRLVDMVTTKPTLMMGLSVQDANIQTIFAQAEASMPWPWPDDRPSCVFSEDRLGVDQQALLRNIYPTAYTPTTRQKIEDGAVIRAYARSLLVALVLHVVCSKLKTLIMDARADDVTLQSLGRLDLDIKVAQDSWRSLQGLANRERRVLAERSARDAHAALDDWNSSSGMRLQGLLGDLRVYFPDLPSLDLDSIGPERVSTVAMQVLSAEVDRCADLLGRDGELRASVVVLDQSIAELDQRAASLDAQIAGHATKAGELAELLTRIREHISSNTCPVCGRDFGEHSTEDLAAYVSKHISGLTASAQQLQTLAGERTKAMSALAELQQQRTAKFTSQMTAAARADLTTRHARLKELGEQLAELVPEVQVGEKLLSTATNANRQLNDIQSQDARVAVILETANRFADELDLPLVGGIENLEGTLSRFLAVVTERESVVRTRKLKRQAAFEGVQERQHLLRRRAATAKAIGEKRQRAARLRESKKKADEVIGQTRELVRRVRQTRVDIVRRVFNESLNAVWQELFVRLAPDEPFVPAFAVPDVQTGPVEAVLETLYRSRRKGGSPQTMLSSGNLNAAALTLFIALHFTVKPTLPWLVIDDPVQSMDEIRIAQFAALLRTLSKQHERQVIVAVQEKPLFDYLTLELSPAFHNDELCTVEIGRTPGGNTEVNCIRQTWKPDKAVAA